VNQVCACQFKFNYDTKVHITLRKIIAIRQGSKADQLKIGGENCKKKIKYNTDEHQHIINCLTYTINQFNKLEAIKVKSE